MKYLIIIGLCLLICNCMLINGQNSPEVRVEQGVLRGKPRQTWNGRTFNSFSGIPYAEPPVGNLRFKSPTPAKAWTGVLDATKLSPICPQIFVVGNTTEVQGSEDCLYLNVYTPQLGTSKNKLLPVLVFIHGGGFFYGSGNPLVYGPDILLDKNVVLVTINYRLGPLGFLSTEDELLPGNWGLKDQTLALKWVKKNINHFGGNCDKITIFGQSSGGVAVHYHLLSPLSRGLFDGAIAHSGMATAQSSLAPKGEALTNAKRLAEFLECPAESKEKIVECVSKASANDITIQQLKFAVFTDDPIIPFKPVIEPNIKGAFITEDPIDLIKCGNVADVPFITGITTQDGAFKSAYIHSRPDLLEQLNREFVTLAPIIFMYGDNPKRDEITSKIKQFYFGDKQIDNSTYTELTNLYTDTSCLYPQAAGIHLHAKYTRSPVYFYIFGIHGSISFSQILGDPNRDFGVCHGDELFYLFSTELFPNYRPNELEKKCNDIMTTIWTTFALTGKPTPSTNSLIKNKWKTTGTDSLSSYFFNSVDDIKMTKDMYKERIEFWKNLKPTLRYEKLGNEL